MPLELDRINALEDQIIRLKQLFIAGHISVEEMEAAIEKCRTELRQLYSFSS